jgi:glycosyltransferase 2 family protein
LKLINGKTLGIVISLLFIGVLLGTVDIQKTVQAFSLMNMRYVGLIVVVYSLAYIIRALRWRILLNTGNLTLLSLLSSLMIGFSLNCVLPARAGEIYRAYFFSKKEGLRKTKVFTSVILERIFDGITLFLMLCAAIYIFSPGDLITKIAFSAGIMFLGSFAVLLIFARIQTDGRRRRITRLSLSKAILHLPMRAQNTANILLNKFFSSLNTFLEEIKMLNSCMSLFGIVFYSFLVWLAEGFAMYMIIHSFGIQVPMMGALLVLSVTAFSTLIPAGPGGIGPYQWGYVIAMGVFGVTKETGFAISIINQMLTITLVLAAGAFFGWKEHINLDDVRQKLEDEPVQELSV